MKRLIVPAISALLFAGLPAQAHSAYQHIVQVAQNDSGRGQDKADRNRSDRGAKQGNSRAQGGGAKGAGQGAVRDRGDNSGGGGQNTLGAGRSQIGGPAATGSGDQGRTRNRAGGAATTRGGVTGGRAMTGGRSGGAAITGGGQTGGTVFGTRPPNWNRYPRQFDTNVYQRNYSATRHFHWRNYNRPNGWYYQRWGFGQIFPRIFWVHDYWLSDYWMFDLPIPPYGYVWVRYGDDAVLINRRTGRILQVVYGVFY